MIFRILLLNLALVALKTNAEEKDSPPVKIKYMTSRAEVFKGEMITVQCLVTSHEQNWDEITVEINRSVFNRYNQGRNLLKCPRGPGTTNIFA